VKTFLKTRALLLSCLLTISLLAAGQRRDSMQDRSLRSIRQLDSIRLADSIRSVAMRMEIKRLKSSPEQQQHAVLAERLRAAEQEDSLRKQKLMGRLEKLKTSTTGFPVAPFGDTLFIIHTGIGSFSAAERATSIEKKIKTLYKNHDFKSDSLKVHLMESSPEIVYKDLMVMSVNEMEALWVDRTQEELASEDLLIIKDAIRKEQATYKVTNIMLRILAVLLIFAGIYGITRLINKLFEKLDNWIRKQQDRALRGIKFSGYQFLDSERELRVILFLTNGLRLLMILVSLYIALPLLFSVFPWSRGIAETLIDWTLSPLSSVFGSFVNYLPNLFAIVVICGVTYYFVQFLKFVAGEIERGALRIPGFFPDWAKPTLNLVKFLVYAFSFIIIFPYLPGSDSPIFQGVSVFVGILFSLGSSSAISNAVAGLVITYMRPFKVGDRIKIGELSGDVIEKSLLVTRIRTIKNENITIPNATILSGHTLNYTTSAQETGLILHTGVTIGYDVPWKQVHELLLSAAAATKGILKEEKRKSFVLQTSLDDFYVAYQLNAYTEDANRMAGIYSDLHQNIQDKFNEAGVEILSPHYRNARDGNYTTVPANYLPKDYQPPRFNVNIENPGKGEGS